MWGQDRCGIGDDLLHLAHLALDYPPHRIVLTGLGASSGPAHRDRGQDSRADDVWQGWVPEASLPSGEGLLPGVPDRPALAVLRFVRLISATTPSVEARAVFEVVPGWIVPGTRRSGEAP